MNKSLLIIILGWMICHSWAMAQCDDGRYVQQIFDNVEVQTDVLFGSTIDPLGNPIDLYMDVYQPAGDTQEARPLILLAYGGSFTAGSKESPDIVALCDSLARYGFVTAAISYRLEQPLNLLYVEKMIQIIYMSVYDGKAAVRYFRKDAAEDNEYRVNSDEIFFGGVSAGAILAIHLAYLNEVDDLQGQFLDAFEGLGVGFEGDSGNLGYSSEIQGVISLAGAVGLPEWIDEGEAPIVSIHSVNDGTVLYGIGSPLQATWLPNMYGSSPIADRAEEVGVRNVLHSYDSSAHPPFAVGGIDYGILSENIEQITTFLAPDLECPMVQDTMVEDTTTTGVYQLTEVNSVRVYPNPVYDNLTVELIEVPVDGVEIRIFDSVGREVISEVSFDRMTKISTDRLSSGIYHVLLRKGQELIGTKISVQ